MTRAGKKPIQAIADGEEVLSRNAGTGALEWQQVSGTHDTGVQLTYKLTYQDERGVERTLAVTETHPFYTGRGWIPVRELLPGDGLVIRGPPTGEESSTTDARDIVVDGRGARPPPNARVLAIEPAGERPTYNLTVAQNHNYFVEDGVLVHNGLQCPLTVGSGGSGANGGRSGTYGQLRGAGAKDAHHVIQDAAVRDLPGYSRSGAPAVELPGPSTRIGSPHYNATQVQRQAGGGTYAAERRIGYKALRRAGIAAAEARRLIQSADNYFGSIGVGPSTPTRIPGNR